MNELEIQIHTLKKKNHKLQERLNRIANVMIGNRRIWELDRLAMELGVEADMLADALPDNPPPGPDLDRLNALREDVLFIQRLEYDLGTLHVAVRGDTNRRGGRYDQADWRGPRP